MDILVFCLDFFFSWKQRDPWVYNSLLTQIITLLKGNFKMIASVIGIDEAVILISASQCACINSSLAPRTTLLKNLAEVLLRVFYD